MPASNTRQGTSARPALPLATLLLWVLSSPAAAGGEEIFRDLTAAAGLDFVHRNGMSGKLYFVEMMGGGAALVDYDGDGDLDLFLSQGERLGDDAPAGDAARASDRLYRNDAWIDADGRRTVRYVDVTPRAGIPAGGYGMGVASADADGDGDPDLYLTNFGSNRLLVNRGDGSFVDATEISGTDDRRWSVAASFFDYDEDGLLDLYVGNYVEYRLANHRDCFSETGVVDYCGPSGFPSESDRLFRNLGGGRFEDVTRRSGIASATGAGLGSVTADLSGDGRIDLYVANDGERNHLWVNQGDGTFVDGALLAGTAVSLDGHPEASMGVVAADLDQDGHLDLFVTHLTNETNTLYLGVGAGMYDDASNDSGLGLPSWTATGFGVALVDLENDGDLDLFVANGAVKRIEELVRSGDPYPLGQRNQLFRNEGGGRFVELTGTAGEAMEPIEVSRGVARGDIDNDGDVDLALVNSAGPARLLENLVGQSSGWIGVSVPARPGRPTPIGTEVEVATADGRHRVATVATDGSYASASDPRRLFGLATSPEVAWLEVRPRRGLARRYLRPTAGRMYVVGGAGAGRRGG